jgi:hypothetical protein
MLQTASAKLARLPILQLRIVDSRVVVIFQSQIGKLWPDAAKTGNSLASIEFAGYLADRFPKYQASVLSRRSSTNTNPRKRRNSGWPLLPVELALDVSAAWIVR